ncbi:MAG: Rrf2 family transcriptional regulator [Gammaproteobacteria bacterium]|nr:Rrf2 family transcriptional regulator [Gammaproteobacteria bacterium]
MQLAQRTDYALRTLVFLALQSNRLSTLNEIAEKFHITREHLIKIVGKLSKLDYVTTARGKGGGIKINSSTLDITLYEIIAQFEPTLNIIDCLHLECPIQGLCRLKSILDEATQAFAKILQSYTLTHILPKTEKEQISLYSKLNLLIGAQ